MAKKGKTKTRKSRKGSRTRITRSLKSSEYVQYRDRKGRNRGRRPRSDLLLYAEVRDRKTKQLKGYLNKFEHGKPIARRFARKQRTVLETPRIERLRREIIQPEKNLDFSIRTNRMIRDSVNEQTELYETVTRKIKSGEKFLLDLHMYANDAQTPLASIYFGSVTWAHDLFVTEVTKVIMDGVNAMQLRTSPKKVAQKKNGGHRIRRPGKNLTRVIQIKVGFSGV